MAWYEWNSSLDIHVKEMNDEHKVLIDLMNSLYEQVEQGVVKEKFAKTLAELVRFTHQHFQDEEQYMYSINYPGLRTHQLIHARLLQQLDQHHESFRQSGKVGKEFFEFLKMWLNAHIKGIDMQYGEHSLKKTA